MLCVFPVKNKFGRAESTCEARVAFTLFPHFPYGLQTPVCIHYLIQINAKHKPIIILNKLALSYKRCRKLLLTCSLHSLMHNNYRKFGRIQKNLCHRQGFTLDFSSKLSCICTKQCKHAHYSLFLIYAMRQSSRNKTNTVTQGREVSNC